jgi:hypothetical protein
VKNKSGLVSLLSAATSACLLITGFAPRAWAQTNAQTSVQTSALTSVFEAAADWTPVLVKPLFAPRPFESSDSLWHLVYDVTLSNYSRKPSDLQAFEILGKDSQGNWSVIKRYEGDYLQRSLLALSQEKSSLTLAPGAAAVLFVNLDFKSKKEMPVALKHRIIFSANLEVSSDHKFDYATTELVVEDEPAVRIGPPLRGGKWVACGGYVGVAGHRQALFAIDNGLHSAQMFAIDWVRMDDQNYTSHDPTRSESYACYGQVVQAVADGKIVGVVDKFADQIPPGAAGFERMQYPGGNSVVQDIGNGNYAFYAHMKPGSIKVKEGDILKRGGEIGLVGNTGNSTGPHLHMHVSRNAGILQADGVPYIFDTFKEVGQVTDFDKFMENDEKGKLQVYKAVSPPVVHHDQLVREGYVVDFDE